MAIQYRTKITPFTPESMTAIAKVLADTETGLTGSEIGYALQQCQIEDTDPQNTKWKRLYNAFAAFQNKEQVGNHVIVFINHAMNPASYTNQREVFEHRRDSLNPVLALCGYVLGDDGQVRKSRKANTLDDALERANRFKSQLEKRNVHADVIQFCTAEIMQQNYFHAVFEAMKSLTVKIRGLSGLTSDGARLVEEAFSLGKSESPRVAINDLSTETDKGEQRAFVNLLTGLFGTVRNPLAHEAKIQWEMTEQDALDIMTMISLIHRKLDGARRV